MPVTTNTVIQKMLKEVQQASRTQNNHSEMAKHIANVKLLCELLLEQEASSSVSNDQISEDEIKAMMGTKESSSIVRKQSSPSIIDHDDANGNSIFDF